MDLMGPMHVESIVRKRYIFVCADDFSRYTWVEFLREKSDAFQAFDSLCLNLKREAVYHKKDCDDKNDHEREFENSQSTNFFN